MRNLSKNYIIGTSFIIDEYYAVGTCISHPRKPGVDQTLVFFKDIFEIWAALLKLDVASVELLSTIINVSTR